MGLRQIKEAMKPGRRNEAGPIKNKWFNFRIPQEWADGLTRVALHHGHNKSTYIRHLIRLDLIKHGVIKDDNDIQNS